MYRRVLSCTCLFLVTVRYMLKSRGPRVGVKTLYNKSDGNSVSSLFSKLAELTKLILRNHVFKTCFFSNLLKALLLSFMSQSTKCVFPRCNLQ